MMHEVVLLYIYGRRQKLLEAADYLMSEGIAFRYSHRSSHIQVLLRNLSTIRKVEMAMRIMHIHTTRS